MKEVDLGYAAGIIDGEGCVSIGEGGYDSWKFRSRKNEFHLYTEVKQTNRVILEWLYGNFGGSVSGKQKGNSPNQKDSWRWTITSRQCANFLKLILPYLKLKQPQAEIAIVFQEQKTQRHGRWRTVKEIDSEIEFFNSIRRLNSGDRARVIIPKEF